MEKHEKCIQVWGKWSSTHYTLKSDPPPVLFRTTWRHSESVVNSSAWPERSLCHFLHPGIFTPKLCSSRRGFPEPLKPSMFFHPAMVFFPEKSFSLFLPWPLGFFLNITIWNLWHCPAGLIFLLNRLQVQIFQTCFSFLLHWVETLSNESGWQAHLAQEHSWEGTSLSEESDTLQLVLGETGARVWQVWQCLFLSSELGFCAFLKHWQLISS